MVRDRQKQRDWLRFVSFLFFGFFFKFCMEIPWSRGEVKLVPGGEAGLWSVSADSIKRQEKSILFVTKWIFKPSEVLLSKQHFQHSWYTRMSGEGSLFLCGLCSRISLSSLILSLFIYLFTPHTCRIQSLCPKGLKPNAEDKAKWRNIQFKVSAHVLRVWMEKTEEMGAMAQDAEYSGVIWPKIFKCVLASAAHTLKLERYRED